MSILYRLDHVYKLLGHRERKHIGVFLTEENAQIAIQSLKTKPGFCDHPTGFKIRKCWYFRKPRLLNRIFWVDGFDTYYYKK